METLTKTVGIKNLAGQQNVMRRIFVEKVTLNIGVGEPGEKLEKALKLLIKISNAKPVKTITMKRIPSWGIRPKLAIGCKVTLRGKKASELLKRLLKALDDRISTKKFDSTGNISFGIAEYIDIPGVEYSSEIGLIGLEIAVTLSRAGFRINRRKINKLKVPGRHRITKDEAIAFLTKTFGVEVY